MKKRLLCLFLGLILVLSVALTACSNQEEEEADVDEDIGAQTITMSIPTTKEVCNTDEELAAYLADECGGDENSQKYQDMLKIKAAYDAVEAEFTKITKSHYKINVDLLFYTVEEYEGSLSATIDKYAEEMTSAARAERALNKYISDYKAAYPEASLGYLTADFDDEAVAKMKEIGIGQLCPAGMNVTREKVKAWHDVGFNVRAWGIKDVELMKHAHDCGVDGMTVNFPDRLISYVINYKE